MGCCFPPPRTYLGWYQWMKTEGCMVHTLFLVAIFRHLFLTIYLWTLLSFRKNWCFTAVNRIFDARFLNGLPLVLVDSGCCAAWCIWNDIDYCCMHWSHLTSINRFGIPSKIFRENCLSIPGKKLSCEKLPTVWDNAVKILDQVFKWKNPYLHQKISYCSHCPWLDVLLSWFEWPVWHAFNAWHTQLFLCILL